MKIAVVTAVCVVFNLFACNPKRLPTPPDCTTAECSAKGEGFQLASADLLRIGRVLDPEKLAFPEYARTIEREIIEALAQGGTTGYVDQNGGKQNVFHVLASKGRCANLILFLAERSPEGLFGSDAAGKVPLEYAADTDTRVAILLGRLRDKEYLTNLEERYKEFPDSQKMALAKATPFVEELLSKDPAKLAFLLGENKIFPLMQADRSSLLLQSDGERIIKIVGQPGQYADGLWNPAPITNGERIHLEDPFTIIAHRGNGCSLAEFLTRALRNLTTTEL